MMPAQRSGATSGVSFFQGVVDKVLVRKGVFRIAAVDSVAGEAGIYAQVLALRYAETADAARVVQPGDTYASPRLEPVHVRAALNHFSHDLMTGNDRRFASGQLAFDDVKIRAADSAGAYSNQYLPGTRLRRLRICEYQRARIDRHGLRQQAGFHAIYCSAGKNAALSEAHGGERQSPQFATPPQSFASRGCFCVGRPLGPMSLSFGGQTLRLRAAPSRALRILQNCRGAWRETPRRPRARPRANARIWGNSVALAPWAAAASPGAEKLLHETTQAAPGQGRCPRRLTSQISSARLSAPSVRGADKSL